MLKPIGTSGSYRCHGFVGMVCNRVDYLEITIKLILKYDSNAASKYALFIFQILQDGPDPNVKNKALTFDQMTYMQHVDHEAIQGRLGELIVYYKIARRFHEVWFTFLLNTGQAEKGSTSCLTAIDYSLIRLLPFNNTTCVLLVVIKVIEKRL
ncbi:alpha-1,3-mannosyl-glycoprotein 2-beta-N-acetylglucosaminyltransferase-like isoform X3 [Silene latifolia]|uniref:alpha-1,3-mannosyl-glycoprotein 2-beta-N-acetylglucosaminyltransferase-like isoform X3 n=1 Tax=Silene latifolia TaxID=37657 RepID=UPI003D77C747